MAAMTGAAENHIPTVSGNQRTLIARQYQRQLFRKAQSGNVIACVDTGSGKTLIAALLLEHTHSLEQVRLDDLRVQQKATRGKISLFLVNLVPLVHQQANFLDQHTSLNVDRLFGEIEIDSSNKQYWDDVLNSETNVIVCTARIALNAIIHAFLKLQDVNLIIFDEAHHAIGNNEYARIMAYYRLVPKAKRPKLFGMTASPLSSGGSFDQATDRLEQLLDSHIFTVPASGRRELSKYVNKPVEMIIEYERAPIFGFDETGDCVQAIVWRAMEHSEDFGKVFSRMQHYWDFYGPTFSDVAWLSARMELRDRAARKDYYADLAEAAMTEDLLNPDIRAHRVQRLRHGAECSRQIVHILNQLKLPKKIQLDLANSSPQIRKIVEVLRCFEAQKEDFCGIIFCSRRLTALGLETLIKKSPSLSFIHPEALVGHGRPQGSLSMSDGLTWEEQEEILTRFRRRSPTNLIIATSVLEEGLDITPVNVVIRFDLPSHHVGFVQSRGRARAAQSSYVLLAERGNRRHGTILEDIAQAEEAMQTWLSSLPDDRLADISCEEGLLDEVNDDHEKEPALKQSYFDERTGARIWPVDATTVLAHYVALLKTDEFCPDGPEYIFGGQETEWQVTVRLPASCPVDEVTGPVMRSKLSAKRMAAFETCAVLHKWDELDEHLAPRRRPREMPDQVQALIGNFTGIGEQVNGIQDNTFAFRPAIPRVFTDPAIPQAPDSDVVLYSHLTKLPGHNRLGEPMRALCLVTAKPLPSSLPPIIFTEYQGQTGLQMEPIGDPIEIRLSRREVKNARTYTRKLLTLVSRRKLKYKGLPYLLLPVADEEIGSIDWDDVLDVVQGTNDVEPVGAELIKDPSKAYDRIFLDSPMWMGGARPFRCVGIDHSKTPFSLRPLGLGQTEPVTYWESFRFARSHHALSSAIPVEEQPLMAVKRLPRRLENYVTTSPKKSAPFKEQDSFLIPEFTWVHSVQASMYESALLMPSLLDRLSQMLIAKELNDKLFGGKIDDKQMIIALTGPTAMHGVSYQRLEFLGDAYLKAIVSAYVFALSDARVEGQLSLDRREIVSNVGLIDRTKHLELGSLLYTRSFTAKTWAPPLCQIEGRKIPIGERYQFLSAKMLADVVESLIGAAIATTVETALPARGSSSFWMNVDLGLEAIVALNLLPAEASRISDIAKMWTAQTWPKKLAEQWDERLALGALRNLEKTINYTFKSPHLALEAMTHPGHLTSKLPSYQRLEFLGDALLDLFVDAWLWKEFPGKSEGSLTTLKSLAVCNQALCALCEYLKLYKFLQTDCQSGFAFAIADCLTDLRLARQKSDQWTDGSVGEAEEKQEEGEEEELDQEEEEDQESSNNASDEEPMMIHYWVKVREIKALADLTESILGAVFVDSGFSFSDTWSFFERLYLPWFKRYCSYDAYLQRIKQAQKVAGQGEENQDQEAAKTRSHDGEASGRGSVRLDAATRDVLAAAAEANETLSSLLFVPVVKPNEEVEAEEDVNEESDSDQESEEASEEEMDHDKGADGEGDGIVPPVASYDDEDEGEEEKEDVVSE